MPDVGDHYRPTDAAHDPGVYRVVGATDEVALLRVTDGDGRRVHTGEVIHVSPAAVDEGFAAADDPDSGFSPLATVRNLLSGLYWDFRKFL